MEKFLLLLVLPGLALSQCLTEDDSQGSSDPEARNAMFVGQQEFSLSLLKTINDQSPKENIFFSPSSVYNAMLLAYFTAGNQTEAALKKTLYIPETQNKRDTLQAYVLEKHFKKLRSLNATDYELASANRLFVSTNQKVRECMQKVFGDEIAMTDFAKEPKAALKTINEWVASQTKNQIKDFLQESHITSATEIVLANAAYFKGWWQSKFLPENTRKEVFHISPSEQAFVTMMRQKSNFNHLASEKIGAHILQLPYKGGNVSLFIILPPYASPNGIGNILDRLNITNFQEIVSRNYMISRQVEVSIPKFTIEQEIKLTPILEKMGVGDLFGPTADLSGLTESGNLKFDDAIHKSKISLDEEGTTAAAATAIFNFRSSRPLDPVRFNCNHPFVYIIFDHISQNVLFTGVFNRPPPTS